MTSRISIILPTYNSIEFLEERLTTICKQTHTNWECIVIDGFSKDGTWERIQEIALTDLRFKLFQFPANGPYDAWNKGIEKAEGEYIYIATADDTMELNLLEVMSKELDEQKDCGLAHCMLTIIDEQSKPSKELNWNDFYPSLYFGNLMSQKHIRVAPLDGILHCGLKTIYTSITQLLIRKCVFNELGLFIINEGSIADFEWGMRVSLLYNTLHVPKYLATWRIHPKQLTANSIQTDTATYVLLCKFIDCAFNKAINGGLNKKYYQSGLKELYLRDQFLIELKKMSNESFFKKNFYLCVNYPVMTIKYFFNSAIFKDTSISWVSKKVEELKIRKNIITQF